jgi:hypothetical protein
VVLLSVGGVPRSRRATFGKDGIPELGNPPHNGEDDAFSDQNTKYIGRNQSTIPTRIEKLIGLGVEWWSQYRRDQRKVNRETDGRSLGLRELDKPARCIDRW